MNVRVAVVQNPPVYLDLAASLERAFECLHQAVSEGADLMVLPEAFLPGYPTWIWRLRPGSDMERCQQAHDRLLVNSVDLEAGGLDGFRDEVAKAGVTVVCGLNERDGEGSRTTLYNTVVVIGPDGQILNRHRKLIPTNPERMVWGRGDASGLRVVDTPAGRIGVLICWENYMPLARQALFSQGVEIYVAPTWDCGEGWEASMRHIAREGGCWVISSAAAVQARDLPEDFPGYGELYPEPEEWLCSGDSMVVAPFSGPVAGPLHRQKTTLYADCDLDKVAEARRSLDVAGHYARPDLFQLRVDRGRKRMVEFEE